MPSPMQETVLYRSRWNLPNALGLLVRYAVYLALAQGFFGGLAVTAGTGDQRHLGILILSTLVIPGAVFLVAALSTRVLTVIADAQGHRIEIRWLFGSVVRRGPFTYEAGGK